MEELRSTEILDKEIQLDARRKAERLLQKTDEDCARIAAEVEDRIATMRSEKEALYAKKIADHNKDVDAAVPLEKQRTLVSFIDTSVHSALDAYLQSLSSERRLQLLKLLIQKYKTVLDGTPVTVYCSGFDVKDVKNLVESVLGKNAVLSCVDSPKIFSGEGAILETAGGEIRCRATFGELRQNICTLHRFELQNVLLGRRLPE